MFKQPAYSSMSCFMKSYNPFLFLRDDLVLSFQTTYNTIDRIKEILFANHFALSNVPSLFQMFDGILNFSARQSAPFGKIFP